MLSSLRKGLLSLLVSLIFLTLLLALYVAYRAISYRQQDDSLRLANKREYLQDIAKGAGEGPRDPNIVFLLFDDMGYGDIAAGAVGSNMITTPNIDRLAAQGVVLSDFHSPAPVCTPSRAGFLTGRLPARAGLPNVVFPTGTAQELFLSKVGNPHGNNRLPSDEITLADVLRAAGYATGMVGKWHLGDRSPSLPNDMGFDSFYGALYSNDMEPFALYRDTTIDVPAPADQSYLTEIYTREAVAFIEAHASDRFFLYFAHNFPHDPLAVRAERRGKSDAGLFGDVMEELDDSVGTIVAALERIGKLENTLFIISSDNGPWYQGDAGNQRGRKGSTFEGGMRVPFIAHWPRGIAGGRVEPAMAMGTDLLPTVLQLLRLPAPSDRVLDGRSILGVLTSSAASPHDYLYYYDGETLFAVRDQRFKYRGPAGLFYGTDQMPLAVATPQKEWLFDLAGDPRESYDTSLRHPQELQRLRGAFEARVSQMQANKRGWD
ncbi:MAG: sulfatase [Halioglobus sp.]|nr:sulfatase [Halioglobus sp.]